MFISLINYNERLNYSLTQTMHTGVRQIDFLRNVYQPITDVIIKFTIRC
jgi:hypothetical protein